MQVSRDGVQEGSGRFIGSMGGKGEVTPLKMLMPIMMIMMTIIIIIIVMVTIMMMMVLLIDVDLTLPRILHLLYSLFLFCTYCCCFWRLKIY